MEKLIELAIKYDREKEWASFDWSITNWEFENHIYQKYLISKEYWFIKWLVENEKIDRDEIIINSDFMPIAFDRKWEKYEWSEEKQLLMLLSIQDEPIRFLCEILK